MADEKKWNDDWTFRPNSPEPHAPATESARWSLYHNESVIFTGSASEVSAEYWRKVNGLPFEERIAFYTKMA